MDVQFHHPKNFVLSLQLIPQLLIGIRNLSQYSFITVQCLMMDQDIVIPKL
jgi:hypothetical protein